MYRATFSFSDEYDTWLLALLAVKANKSCQVDTEKVCSSLEWQPSLEGSQEVSENRWLLQG